jgi:YD repeat-containing protein
VHIIRITIFIFIISISLKSQVILNNPFNDTDKSAVRSAAIKSLIIKEYYYNKETNELTDSVSLLSYKFDRDGNEIEKVKYHIYSELNLKETYEYNTNGKISKITRYNKNDDIIETSAFKYINSGKVTRQKITQFYNNPNASYYFAVQARVEDDSIFNRLQTDLGIDPHLDGYTITVNLTDNDPQNHYVIIGDESDATSMRFSWSQLSLPVQKTLMKWEGPNRTNKKYTVQNLSKINYSYDKSGNVISKIYYNTANDVTRKEYFYYDEAGGKNTGYEKYNATKLLFKENYSFNDYGKITLITNTGGRTEFTYDTLNNITERSIFNSAGSLFGKTIYRYENNKLVEELNYGPDELINSKVNYGYNERGNLVSVIYYDEDYKKGKELSYQYEFY